MDGPLTSSNDNSFPVRSELVSNIVEVPAERRLAGSLLIDEVSYLTSLPMSGEEFDFAAWSSKYGVRIIISCNQIRCKNNYIA